jgi:hypothetical protein
MRRSLRLPVLACAIVSAAAAQQQPVNPDAAKIVEFQNRVVDYVKVHKQAAAELAKLKPTEVPATIERHEQALAPKIREARKEAKRGDIFTPSIEAEFRRLIGITMKGERAARIRASLHHAEPVQLTLAVNQVYPRSVPLQSTPPSLLLNLPELPKEVEYRIVGHALVLRDVDANIVVDYIPDAMSY